MSSVYIWWYWFDIIIRDKLIFETNIQSSHGSEYYYCNFQNWHYAVGTLVSYPIRP
jgi:hypothetical protein